MQDNLAKKNQGTGDFLEPLKTLVSQDMERVNAVILESLASAVPLIPEVSKHLMKAGGKRLRPMLTLASSYLCGYEGARAVSLAACVEFIHAATLLHDDVVDESHLRRGLVTANTVWGNKPSILVGDFIFARAFQLMVADGSLGVLKLLSDTSVRIVEGEVLQLSTTGNLETDEAACLEVICSKTAPLFEAACGVGAFLGEGSSEVHAALLEYGRCLGIAFQIVDDVLDYISSAEALGKEAGDDFRESKVTLPVILAHTQATSEEKNFWDRVIVRKEQQENDFEMALSIMNKYDVFEKSLEKAEFFLVNAKKELCIFPESLPKIALRGVADFCMRRSV